MTQKNNGSIDFIKGVFEMRIYLIATQKNENGNKVLKKVQKNGKTLYLAVEQNSGTQEYVDRDFILDNKGMFINITVTKDKKIVYSKENDPFEQAKNQYSLIRDWYFSVFWCNTPKFKVQFIPENGQLELHGYLEDGFMISLKLNAKDPYNIDSVCYSLETLARRMDDYKMGSIAKEICNMTDLQTPCEYLDKNDPKYHSLLFRYETLKKYQKSLEDLSNLGAAELIKTIKKGYKRGWVSIVNHVYGSSGYKGILE